MSTPAYEEKHEPVTKVGSLGPETENVEVVDSRELTPTGEPRTEKVPNVHTDGLRFKVEGTDHSHYNVVSTFPAIYRSIG
jgi:hypothetical protein